MVAETSPPTIRSARPAEVPALAAFIAECHESPALGAWAGDALSGRHPTVAVEHALVAVAPGGAIVGATVVIPQAWRYGTGEIPVGQLEAVGVAPAYRGRGLARALIAAAHRLSAAQGHLLQAVVGPPNWYRRFGYGYALRFRGGRAQPLLLAADTQKRMPEGAEAGAEGGAGRQFDPMALVRRWPAPALDQPPPHVRPATLADIPALLALEAAAGARLLLRPRIDAARWAYDLAGHSPESDAALRIDLVCADDGAPLAYARSFPAPWDGELSVAELAIGAAEPEAVAAALIDAWRARFGAALTHIAWELDGGHPLFAALGEALEPRRPSAWYLRAPDLAALLARVAPVRCAEFGLQEADLAISTYGGGVRLRVAAGAATVSPWAGPWHAADAALPPEALLGYRGLAPGQKAKGKRQKGALHPAALLDIYPDVLVSPGAAAVLSALFPPRESHVIPLG